MESLFLQSEQSEWQRCCFCLICLFVYLYGLVVVVKATGFFKFDVHVPRHSPDMTAKNFLGKGSMSGSCNPLNFWLLNANSSKMETAADFKFDLHFSRDSPDMTPEHFCV